MRFNENWLLLGVLTLLWIGAEGFSRRRRYRPSPPPDRTPPVVFCPDDINVIADKFQLNAFVKWTEPIIANDDRDGSMTATRCGPAPNTWFSRGTTKVTYYARDRSNNKGQCSFTVSVTVVYCPRSETIDNGYFIYHPAMDFRYGGISNYGCHRGYKLVGTSRLECLEHNRVGYWSATTPRCIKIQCNQILNLLPIPNGDINCTDTNKYKSKCTYTCKAGYRIKQGQSRVRVCSFRGFWLGSQPSCQDVEGPKFRSCPKSMVVYTVRNNDKAAPLWLRPSVNDNSGESVSVTLLKGYEAGQWMPVGTHEIVYTAKDSANNEAKPCKFIIIVRRLMCPTIYPTPYLEVVCDKGYGFGEKCSFQCDVGQSLVGENTATCEARGNPSMAYWTWGVSMPTCQGRKCAPLSAPANGALACDKWLYGEFCKMFCKQNYDVLFTERTILTSIFVCGNTGHWTGVQNQKAPDCSPTRRPIRYNTRSEAHYFTGDCCDPQVQLQIKSNYIMYLNSSQLRTVCQRYASECIAENVEVVCGTPNQCAQGRKKRTMSLTIKGQISYTSSKDSTEDYTTVSQRLKDLASIVETISKNNPPAGSTYEGFESGRAEIECDKNFKPSGISCVPCETGYAMNSKDECEACPIGYYQDGTGDFQCTKCPLDKTTAKTGTKSSDQCIDLCSKGSFSSFGTVPCTPCPTASYAETIGSKNCTSCPPRTTTNMEGATSSNDCQNYKLIFIPQKRDNYTVTSQISSGSISSLTIAAKIYLPEEPIFIGTLLRVNDDKGEEIVSVSIGKTNNISVRRCNYTLSGTFLLDNWNSILITLSSQDPKVYLHGQLIIYDTDCKGVNFPVVSGSVDIIMESNEELNDTFAITDVNIWDNTLTAPTVMDISSTCSGTSVGNTMSWAKIAEVYPGECTVPAECDVTNNCKNNPCEMPSLNKCIDKINNYTCVCHDGFTGRNCGTNLDDCVHNICENNATCVDGINKYTCNCTTGYRGEYCEIPIVNGNWSEWSDWTKCSVTCNNGTQTRQRNCDQPPPDADGLPCDGKSTDIAECAVDTCKSCMEFPFPNNGYSNCTDDPATDMTNCTVTCNPGYAFVDEPLDIYSCGYLSNYTWSSNDTQFTLPVCTKVEAAKNVSVKHTVAYSNTLKCTRESVELLNKIITEKTQEMKCVTAKQCEVTNVDINCPTQKRSTSSLSFVLIISMKGMAGTQSISGNALTTLLSGYAQALYDAVETLYSQIASGNFTVETSFGTHLVLGQEMQPQITCYKPGYTWIDYFCIPCLSGSYEDNYICLLCPVGTYNPYPGQTQCISCPAGLTTSNTGSQTQTNCNVEQPTTQYTPTKEEVQKETKDASMQGQSSGSNITGVISGVSAAVVIVILAVVIVILVYKKCQKNDQPTVLRNQRQENVAEDPYDFASNRNTLPPKETTIMQDPWRKMSRYNHFENRSFADDRSVRKNTDFLWTKSPGTNKSVNKVNVQAAEANIRKLPFEESRPPSVVSIACSLNSNASDSAVAPLD